MHTIIKALLDEKYFYNEFNFDQNFLLNSDLKDSNKYIFLNKLIMLIIN